MKFTVDVETAEAEFERMCDAFRIDHSTEDLDEKELEEWMEMRSRIVKDLRTGLVIVSEDGLPSFTPPDGGNVITFHRPTGATTMALETHPGQKNIANLYAAMADMTRQDRGVFAKMFKPDVDVCVRLARLFLADG